jgi:hypothetical protein
MALRDELHAPGPHLDPGPAGVAGPPRTSGGLSVRQDVINPDADSIRELDHMHWGVEMARNGGVSADRVLNAMPLPEIAPYLRQRRHRSLARAA